MIKAKLLTKFMMLKKMESSTGKYASVKMMLKILEEMIIMERLTPKDGWKTHVRPLRPPMS